MEKYSLTKIEELAQGNHSFVNTIVLTFVEQLPEAIENMSNHLAESDLENLGREAHKLKPSLDLFSINSGMELVRLLEDYNSFKSPEHAVQVHDKLIAVLTEVLQLLKARQVN